MLGSILVKDIRLLIVIVFAIALGIPEGLVLALIVIASQEIIYMLLVYAIGVGLVVILILAIYLFLLKRLLEIEIPWIYMVLRNILLVDFLIILFSVAYVVFFNLLNMLCPYNTLLLFCSLLEKLSKQQIELTIYIFIGIMALINSYVAYICFDYLQKTDAHRLAEVLKRIATMYELLVVLIIIFLLLTCLLIDYRYLRVTYEFNKRFPTKCVDIDCLWNFVKYYASEFVSTHEKPCPKPRQLLIRLPLLSDINNRDFVAKLAVASRTGACLDFALGATKLIEDFYGCKVRVVEFIGWDHVVPEVEVNGIWYVIDVTYTTKDYPVKASEYADYLRRNYPSIYINLKRLVDFDTGQDLSREHGFRS